MDTAARPGADQPEEEEFARQAGEQHANNSTLPNAEVERRARVFNALGNETRLRILRSLLDGEMCVSEIVERVGGAASTIAHHLRTLENAGLIASHRRGRSTFYFIQEQELSKYQVFE
jgi:DNA-binding transcriptional ArsR family regulator